MLSRLPEGAWDAAQIPTLVDNLIGYLSAMPASNRTSANATQAMELCRNFASRLPAAESQAILDRLENLDVRIIAIGTVPRA